MAEPSTLRGVISFFTDIGIYDVILPFLLIFTLVYAIFEKTKVFGTDTIDGMKYPKKNLNAIAAFAIAFFVIASAQLVEFISKVSSHVVVLLLAVVFFLMLIGTFMKETEEGVFLEDQYKGAFIGAMLIGIILIFLNALNWLDPLYNFLKENWSEEWVASILLIFGVVIFIGWISRSPVKKQSNKKD
ncbi:hypothetical protein A3K72_00010 [Candidatus Woesearchaeota archaeon RBG_13_36_6]|nr:MAG: hypothetical protein A3K72_00010 [Candidatus Woesearchaeota archaeon RBG_13_36_6]